MPQVKGSQLKGNDAAHVLASYVHRYTKEHKPQWAINTDYPVQFESDQDWLGHTIFNVKNDGYLDARFNACQSSPTWPDNPELRKS